MDCSTIDLSIVPVPQGKDVLGEVLRQGAQKLLAEAIDAEVADWIDHHAHLRTTPAIARWSATARCRRGRSSPASGQSKSSNHGCTTGGSREEREKFSSAILPPYLRKTKSIEELIPWLYLKGVSTGDFSEALAALLGPDAPGLSASTVVRLKAVWETEYQGWSQRSLEGKRYVYVWADGVHFNIRLEEDRQCILVLMGATADGQKELIAIADGYREIGAIVEGVACWTAGAGPGR